MNKKFYGQFIKEKTVQLIRQFFLDQNFHEIETPTLLPSLPLEPNLYPLKTTWTHKNKDFFFVTSPESSLKKIISQGVGNCFSIQKVVRDLEDLSPTHNLEFSMLEWYEIGKNYKDIAKTTQNLILYLHRGVQKYLGIRVSNILKYQDALIDLSLPWYSYTLEKLFQKFANIDLNKNLTFSAIKKIASEKGYNTKDVTSWEPLYTQIFINEIESQLPTDKPVIIYDYPTQMSPLACRSLNEDGSPSDFSERFEFYIGGMEIGNAYTENTNSKDLLILTKKELKFRQKNNLPTHPFDIDFIESCARLPECAGIGLGIDRLAMLFSDTANISDVLYFPTSKLLK